jgi:hypothetical protein
MVAQRKGDELKHPQDGISLPSHANTFPDCSGVRPSMTVNKWLVAYSCGQDRGAVAFSWRGL